MKRTYVLQTAKVLLLFIGCGRKPSSLWFARSAIRTVDRGITVINVNDPPARVKMALIYGTSRRLRQRPRTADRSSRCAGPRIAPLRFWRPEILPHQRLLSHLINQTISANTIRNSTPEDQVRMSARPRASRRKLISRF